MAGGDGKSATKRAMELVARNRQIVSYRLVGYTFPEIAEKMGVSLKTAQRAYAESRDADLYTIKGEDAEDVVFRALEGYRLARVSFWEVYEQARGNHTARIGALKGWMAALNKETELRQAAGLLP